jgi:hypothetical protein
VQQSVRLVTFGGTVVTGIAAKLLSYGEARRIAANIAKLPELLKPRSNLIPLMIALSRTGLWKSSHMYFDGASALCCP